MKLSLEHREVERKDRGDQTVESPFLSTTPSVRLVQQHFRVAHPSSSCSPFHCLCYNLIFTILLSPSQLTYRPSRTAYENVGHEFHNLTSDADRLGARPAQGLVGDTRSPLRKTLPRPPDDLLGPGAHDIVVRTRSCGSDQVLPRSTGVKAPTPPEPQNLRELPAIHRLLLCGSPLLPGTSKP